MATAWAHLDEISAQNGIELRDNMIDWLTGWLADYQPDRMPASLIGFIFVHISFRWWWRKNHVFMVSRNARRGMTDDATRRCGTSRRAKHFEMSESLHFECHSAGKLRWQIGLISSRKFVSPVELRWTTSRRMGCVSMCEINDLLRISWKMNQIWKHDNDWCYAYRCGCSYVFWMHSLSSCCCFPTGIELFCGIIYT